MAEQEKPDKLKQDKPSPEPEQAQSSGPGLLSPIGALMLFTAVFFDMLGLLFMAFTIWYGLDDFGILDFTASVFMGILMFASTGSISLSKGGQTIIKKILKKLGLNFFIKFIPWVGNAIPSWTITTFLHLRK